MMIKILAIIGILSTGIMLDDFLEPNINNNGELNETFTTK